jgi:hypothetical protein
MRPHSLAAAAAAALLAEPSPAQDEGEVVQRLERQLRELDRAFRLEIPEGATLSDRLLLDYGASLQFGVYSIDDAGSEDHVLRQSDGRAWVRAELDGVHRFFARARFRYDDWNSGDDFDGRGDELDDPIGERWWYELDLRGGGDGRDLKLGKQFVEWGNGLALSDLLIGAVATADLGGLQLSLLAADTPVTDFVDVDGSRPSFDRNTKRRFLGAQLAMREDGVAPFVHVLSQADHNDRDSTTFQDALGQLYATSLEYDSTYVGLGARGTLGEATSWRAEVDWETGRALSSPIDLGGVPGTQTQETIRAFAFAAALAHAVGDERDSRVDLELIAGSGDDDRLDSADTFGGNRTGTIDKAWNGFGYLNTGLALAPEPSNLVIVRAGGVTSPLLDWGADVARLRAVLDGYLFLKIESDAPINVPTVTKRLVGGEVDLGFDWNVHSDLSLNFRWGLFLPGDAMPTGQDGTRQVLFLGITYAF